MNSYTASHLYRQQFIFLILWLILIIAVVSGGYHFYLNHEWVSKLKGVLAIGSTLLLWSFSKISLQTTIALTLTLTYGIIFLCMIQDADIGIWMLTLPAFSFVTLKKEHVPAVNSAGGCIILISFGIDTWYETKHFSESFMMNLVGSYFILSYACLLFHKLIAHYRDDLAETMAEKRKLEAARTLSSGVAHLINNHMTTIIGYASLLEYSDRNNQESIQNISESAFKTSKHANDLLAYTEQSVMDHNEWIDVQQSIQHCLKKMDISETIEVKFNTYHHQPIYTMGNKQQMSDTILDNVLLNAAESNPKSIIHINITLDHIQQHPTLKQGKYLRIDVQDDGDGINPENIKRVFDPFYSTKFMGRGMGLAAAFGAIKRHQGHIKITSELTKGTTCTLWLPTHDTHHESTSIRSF